MKTLLLLIALVVNAVSGAQVTNNVIIIDPALIPQPQPTGNFNLECVAFRYIPKKGGRAPEIPAAGDLYPLFQTLSKSGTFNLLYFGSRSIHNLETAVLRSLEIRPVFTLNEAANKTLTNRNFGLNLQVSPKLTSTNYIAYKLTGSFSWSPELLDYSASEKYIVLGFRLAGLIQPGLVRETSDDEEADTEPSGINLRTLFSRKKNKEKQPAEPAVKPVDLSWLETERREIQLDSTHFVPVDHWLALTYPEKTISGEPQFLCFLLKASTN